MRLSRAPLTFLLAVLSLGLVGHFPKGDPATRRHISSACGDATQPSAPSSSFPAFPSGLFSSVQDDAVRQAAEAYALFQRQLQLNAALGGPNPFVGPSAWGFAMPSFPSYELPDLSRYQVSLVKPDTSGLLWGGLAASPQLQYLVRPLADSKPSIAAGSGAAGTLDGLIDLAPIPSARGASFTSSAVPTTSTPRSPSTAVPPGPDLSQGGRFQVSKF